MDDTSRNRAGFEKRATGFGRGGGRYENGAFGGSAILLLTEAG